MTTSTEKPKKYHLFIYDLSEAQIKASRGYNRRGNTRFILKVPQAAYSELKRKPREYYRHRSKQVEDLLNGCGPVWFDAQLVWDIVHNGIKLE